MLKFANFLVAGRLARFVGRSFDRDFGDAIPRLKQHAHNVDQTAVATHLLRAEEFHQKHAANYREDLNRQIINWLHPSDVRIYLEKNLQMRLDGTCDWIRADPMFSAWTAGTLTSVHDRLLYICGKPGCGKTILASWLADSLSGNTVHSLFFPFSSTDATRQTTDDLIRSLIWQILRSNATESIWDTVHGLMSKGPPLTSELWIALESIIRSEKRLFFFVIDGVDECNDPEGSLRNHFQNLLQNHLGVRVALVGRSSMLPRNPAQSTTPPQTVFLTSELIKQDIDAFITNEVNLSTIFQSPKLKGTLIKSLRDNSDGMFLWVRLVAEDLRKSSSIAEAMLRLNSLPRGLEEAYKLILRRLHSSLREDDLQLRFVRNILTFTIVARRPLTFEEVRYALAMESKASIASERRPLDDYLHLYSVEEIIAVCGNLVSVTDGHVHPLHASLQEFLTRSDDAWEAEVDPSIREFRVKLEVAHGLFASICIDYLQLDDYGLSWNDADSLSSLRSQCPFLEYSSVHVVYHANRSRPTSPEILDKVELFLTSGRCVSWIEHYFTAFIDDETVALPIIDLQEFVLWLGTSDRASTLFSKVKLLLEEELLSRINEFGEGDLRTKRWKLLADIAEPLFLDTSTSDTERPTYVERFDLFNRRAPSTNPNVAVSQLQRMIGSSPRTSLSPRLQMEMILNLRDIFAIVRKLTDPLELLFQMILERAATVPIYMLYAISAFYHGFRQFEKALKVLVATLDKLNDRNNWQKPWIYYWMAWIHCDLSHFDSAHTNFRLAAQCWKSRSNSRHPTCVAKMGIMTRLGNMLLGEKNDGNLEDFMIAMLKTNEAILKTNKIPISLLPDQICVLNSWIGMAHFKAGDFKDAERWLLKALTTEGMKLKWHWSRITYATSLLGRSLYFSGQYEEAKVWLHRARDSIRVSSDGKNNYTINVLAMLGRCCCRLEHWEEALQFLKLALCTAKDWATSEYEKKYWGRYSVVRAILDLAKAHFDVASYAASLECFRIAQAGLDSAPSELNIVKIKAEKGIGLSCYGLCKFEEGVEWLQKAHNSECTVLSSGSDAVLFSELFISVGQTILSSTTISPDNCLLQPIYLTTGLYGKEDLDWEWTLDHLREIWGDNLARRVCKSTHQTRFELI